MRETEFYPFSTHEPQGTAIPASAQDRSICFLTARDIGYSAKIRCTSSERTASTRAEHCCRSFFPFQFLVCPCPSLSNNKLVHHQRLRRRDRDAEIFDCDFPRPNKQEIDERQRLSRHLPWLEQNRALSAAATFARGKELHLKRPLQEGLGARCVIMDGRKSQPSITWGIVSEGAAGNLRAPATAKSISLVARLYIKVKRSAYTTIGQLPINSP